jgi:tetratricopeptide (TPR) repeat protein
MEVLGGGCEVSVKRVWRDGDYARMRNEKQPSQSRESFCMPLHHYLPASFIARFSIDNKTKMSRDRKVVVGDKKTQRCFSSPASKIGCINNLYTLVDNSSSPELVDQTWKEYERKLPAAVDNLIRGNVDAETWARVLVPFVACMLVRGPDFKERFNRRFPPEFQQMMNDVVTPDNTNLARLIEIQRLLVCIVAAKWIVLTAHGKEKLITNDLGYAPFINAVVGHRGLAIPLGQKSVLAIVPSMEENVILYEKDGQWVPKIEYLDIPPGNQGGLNEALAHNALRFVFGPDFKTVQKYHHGVPQLTSVPNPIELGFPEDLISPAYEFTWHRLVGIIKKKPFDETGWDFKLDMEEIGSGWCPPLYFPTNLVEFPPALQKVNNTIRLKIYDPNIYFEISRIPLLEEEQRYDDIVEIVTKALKHNLSPTLRTNLLSSRGSALDNLGKVFEAVADYEEACKLDIPNAKTFTDYGYILLKTDNANDAITALSKAIDLDPKFGVAYLNRGMALAEIGRLSESIEDSTIAIELLTKNAEKAGALFNRGLAYRMLSNDEKAAEDFYLAASLYQDPITKAKCFTLQAKSLMSIGLVDNALEACNRSVDFNSKDCDTLIGRALIHLKRGEIEDAFKDKELAILNAPDLETKVKIMEIKELKSAGFVS